MSERGPSQATRLVELVLERGTILAHTPGGDLFAIVDVDGHGESWLLRARGFRRWAARIYYENEGRTPNAQALRDALHVLEAQALAGREESLHTRVGTDGLGTLYLDLCTSTWEVVEVHAGGWRIAPGNCTPICFRRAAGMLCLSLPEPGGDLAELRELVNVGSEEDWVLLVAWLVGALRTEGPYPVLVLQGEQGSAKSTTARILRSLVDPNQAAIRAEPREPRDLMIAARNGWVIALDNLSHVEPWLSDALCRLATGGGFATRALYTDDDEIIFEAQRPVILTGIDSVVSRSDLLDRAMLVTLPTIPENRRRTEAELWAAFERSRARLLGALLDTAVEAIRRRDEVRLDRMPRMADYAAYVVAAEARCPWQPGRFMTAYAGARARANEMALEGSLVAQTVITMMKQRTEWSGTAGELLEELERLIPETRRRSRGWPRSARGLSAEVRRTAPNLRAIGIDVQLGGRAHGGRRLIRLMPFVDTPHPPDARRESRGADPHHRHHDHPAYESAGLGGDDDGDDRAADRHRHRHDATPQQGSAGDEGDGGDGLFAPRRGSLMDLESAGVKTWVGDDGELWTDPPPARLSEQQWQLFREALAEHRSARGMSADA